ncbi:MAG: acetate/propionate family kinase [Rhodobacterales bacterium]|nr:acetate/propionate family kinase [Rhodobacterales bacterium]
MTSMILTLNAGSSSLKFAMFGGGDDQPVANGQVDRIGSDATIRLRGADGLPLSVTANNISTHAAALRVVLEALNGAFPRLQIGAVGHRVVHGGPDFAGDILIDATVLQKIAALSPFAPLHQPHNIAGIIAAGEAFPGTPQVACFDTAFHRQHPWVHDTFGLPRAYYDKGVRRYGFHGLSYDYIAGELARIAPRIHAGRVVVAHLGNGASICAMEGGRSITSTMGFSALDGLAMGTRPGQLDPGVMLYLMEQEGLGTAEISDLLYKQSGLLGLSGESNDMRVLEASTRPEAAEAIDYFVTRIVRETGALAASLGGIDALVFCGGIGENAAGIRDRVCARMGWMGIRLDRAANATHATVISAADAPTTVMVIPTNEELVIARATRRLCRMA